MISRKAPSPLGRAFIVRLFAVFFLALAAVETASAAAMDCGQPLSAGANPTATDALYVLNVAVGFGTCELCVCDADDSGAITATDALRTLSRAVGISVELSCQACEPVSLCDGLSPISTSGEPFDTIDIDDIPQSYDSVWAIITPTVGDPGVAGVLLDDDNGDRLMVPLHPSGSVDGGPVTVAVTDGIEVCPIGTLEILPLPDAPADTSTNTLAAFLALIDAIAADFGLTGTELAMTALSDLPTQLIPIALAQAVLAGPDNDNSLSALFAGTAPDADGLDIDLLNRCFAKIGLETALEERIANRLPITPTPLTVRPAQSLTASGNGSCVFLEQPADFEIADAEELSLYMQEGLANRNDQASLNTVVEDSLAMLATIVGLANTGAGASGAAALYAWNQLVTASGNLLPALLTKIEFDIESGGRIPEDRMDGTGIGTTPFDPEWSDPRLYATNLGMDLTRSSLELLLTVVNFLPLQGLPGVQLLKAGSLDGANQLLDEFDTADCWQIPPTTWGPIGGARDPEYVEARFTGSSVMETSFGSFQPIALGITQLRLRTTDAFSGPPVTEEKDIEVVRKRISIQMPTITVEPGDPVEVFATVVDAAVAEELEWTFPAFLVSPTMTLLAGGTHKLSFTSPTDRTLFPFEVTARSTSLELPPDTPKREGTATIKTDAGIMITPRAGCVSNGATFDLTAMVTGLAETEDDSVNWSQFGSGNLVPGADNTAVYTAPGSGEGEVLIEATLNIDGEVTDEISLLYGACKINFDLGWYAGSSTYDPGLPADIDQMKAAYYSGPLFPQEGDKLMPPTNWSNGATRNVTTANTSTYFETVRDDMGVDHEVPLSSSSTIDAQLTSTSGTAAAMSMSWTTSAECKAIPNSDNGIVCSSGQAQFDWVPVFWIEIEEAGTYEARFTMSCTRSGSDGFFGIGANANLARHRGGSATGGFPNTGTTGPSINALNPFNVTIPPPLPFPLGSVDFVCEPGEDIDVTAVWELGGPVNPPEPDIVALSILVQSYMVSPVDFFEVSDPPVGSYTQSGTLSGTVSVVRTGP